MTEQALPAGWERPALFLVAAVCLTTIFSTALMQTFVVLLTLVVIVGMLRDPRHGFRHTPLDLPYIAFALGRVLSVIFSQDPVQSVPALYKEVFYYGVFFLVTQSVRRKEKEVSIALAITLIVAAAGAGLIGSAKVLAGFEPRASSTTAGTYTLGGYLCVVLPLLGVFRSSGVGTVTRWMRTAAALAIGSGVVLTFDRLHWAEAAAVLGSIVLWGQDWRKWIFLSGGLSTFLFLPSVQLRLGRTFAYADFLGGRDLIWAGAFARMMEHPFLGFGPRTFTEVFPRVDHLPVRGVGSWHNDYIQVYMDSGLLALVPLFWLLGSIIAGAMTALRSSLFSPDEKRIVQSLFISLGAVAIFGGLLDTHVGIIFRVLLGLFAVSITPRTPSPFR